MFGWLVRIVMALAAIVTGWFVVSDSPNFGIVQMAVSLLLIALFVAGMVFWPWLISKVRGKSKPES